MNCYVKYNLLFCYVWTIVISIWLIIGEGIIDMTILEGLAIAVLPSLVTCLVTLYLARKSDIKENTARIEKLMELIGAADGETLCHQVNHIRSDIGRGDRETLTKQHLWLKKCINEGFDMIRERYTKEDSDYRYFTTQQHDIKKVIDAFSQDYSEQIKQVTILKAENISLKQEIETLNEELQYYRELELQEPEHGGMEYDEPEL